MTDIVVACENTLGWVPDPGKPLWKARSVEAGKLNRAAAKDPKKVTVDNLALAVEFSRKRRRPVTSPLGLIHRIEDALVFARDETVLSDLGQAVQDAVNLELFMDRHDAGIWITRLTRAQGEFRLDVLNEWKEAGRG